MKLKVLPYLLFLSTLLLLLLHLSLAQVAAQTTAHVEQAPTVDSGTPMAPTPSAVDAAVTVPGKPAFTHGQLLDQPLIYADQLRDNPQAAESINAAPVITIWSGLDQTFGQIGNPIPWVNILGNVASSVRVKSLTYTLNGGAAQTLSMGADKRRLAQDGDFNVELDINDLNNGVNQIVITAIDKNNEQSTVTVTVNYHAGNQWPLPYIANWSSSAKINDVAQIVDGQWAQQVDGTVHPTWLDYDRLIAIGDQQWTDYEVTVPLTIHAIDGSGFPWPSSGPGIGLLLRWPGHFQASTEQPRTGWQKLGALGWFRWNGVENGPITAGLQLIGYGGPVLMENPAIVPQFETPYIMKMRVESPTVADQGARYRFKVWEAANAEPTTWALDARADVNGPTHGALLLVAHHVNASIGNVVVQPLGDQTPRVTLKTNIVGNGAVAVDPPQVDYAQGQTVTLTAQPAEGMAFAGWSGDLQSAANPALITLDRHKVVTATFIQRSYALITNAMGQGSVQIDPPLSSFPHGSVVTVTALPATGWRFAGWSGALTDQATPRQLTMDGNKSLTATFVEIPPNSYQLTTTVVGEGTVARTPDQAAYLDGTVVTLTATAATGWQFTGWQGDLAGVDPLATITMSGTRNVTATFALLEYPVKVIIVGNGNVNRAPDLALYPHGTVLTLTAAANSGWHFAGWQGAVVGSNSVKSLVVDSAKVVTATFVEEHGNDLSLLATTGTGGQITVEPLLENYPPSTVVTITAVPTAGWRFVGWLGDIDSSANPLVLTMTQDLAVQAQFAQDLAHFTSAVEGGGQIASSRPPGTYPVGTVITLTANPAPDAQFLGWAGALQGTQLAATLLLDTDKHVIARFGPITHTVTVQTTGNGQVTPVSGVYQHNETIQLTATADSDSLFVGWSGAIESTTNPLEITVTDDLTIVANFIIDVHATGGHTLYLPLVMK